MSTQDDLVAALNNHQVTDTEGQVAEETAGESTTQIETPVEDDATAEKSVETEATTPVAAEGTENPREEPEMVETASDETGKRYVPEDRFKKVYGKWKDAERKLQQAPATMPTQPVKQQPLERTDALEIELLRSTLPQFNPENPEYSQEIDELGYSLYESSKDAKGKYTMTRIDAGRKALSMAKKITAKVAEIKSEARIVKTQQSDQGITNRVLNREGQQVDPMTLPLEEKEAWLKAHGEW